MGEEKNGGRKMRGYGLVFVELRSGLCGRTSRWFYDVTHDVHVFDTNLKNGGGVVPIVTRVVTTVTGVISLSVVFRLYIMITQVFRRFRIQRHVL